MNEEPQGLMVSYFMWYVFAFWKQAEPKSFEIAALSRLAAKEPKEMADLLNGQDWWRLGPFHTETEAKGVAEQLRLAGLRVETKRG